MFDCLVIGGAASGKSAFAEARVIAGGAATYLATGEAFDGEMADKIAIHQARRGAGWQTVEAPLDGAGALMDCGDAPVLFDCATLWLSNQMMADADLPAATETLLTSLAACPAPVTVVTNEVGHGIVPADALSRRFREAQGRLNISLAAAASSVVLVTAGLPLWLKGSR